MMDYTDRHCRYLLRLLSPGALLYTEMVTTQALLRGEADRLLAFDPSEHPVALQLGGSDPLELAEAAALGAGHGYDEINLNCGCPSDRVQSGRFGACLMADAERVAECVRAMRAACAVPVTVKCRIGIEPRTDAADDYDFLERFVSTIAMAGCEVFIVHARIAILDGLSPRANREVPPLRYDIVRRLRREFPALTIVLNGGLRSAQAVREALASFDGAMMGREAWQNPYLLAHLHHEFCDPSWSLPDRADVVARFAEYADARLAEGQRLPAIVRPLLNLYAGQPGARSWRRLVSEQMSRSGACPELLLRSLEIFRDAICASGWRPAEAPPARLRGHQPPTSGAGGEARRKPGGSPAQTAHQTPSAVRS